MAKIATANQAAFDPTQHETEQRDYANLPDGDYKLEISASQGKRTPEDESLPIDKFTLKVTYDVIEPEQYKGRKLFGNFNLVNPSAQAQQIGESQFAALNRAIGNETPVEDSEDLHFRSFMAKVGMGKDSKEKNGDGSPVYPAKNEIKKFYFPDENNVPAPKAQPRPAAANDNTRPANDNRAAAPAAAATAPAGKRPWATKRAG